MIEKNAMYAISYGLYMLTTTDGEKQNGCIVNTVSMITDNPTRIVVFVNKANRSYLKSLMNEHEMTVVRIVVSCSFYFWGCE